jgi:phosphatidylserine/phosphatidylglycerophosphate/cardiolipin synthase-like enzyme
MNDRYAIMHNKFMIIDGITLETGSFNFTKAAERRNSENVLVIHDDPQLVKDYMQQWENLWQQGKDFTLQPDHKH